MQERTILKQSECPGILQFTVKYYYIGQHQLKCLNNKTVP